MQRRHSTIFQYIEFSAVSAEAVQTIGRQLVFLFVCIHFSFGNIRRQALVLHATNNKICLVNVKPITFDLYTFDTTHTKTQALCFEAAFFSNVFIFLRFSASLLLYWNNNAENETATYITERASFAFLFVETCIFTNSIFFRFADADVHLISGTVLLLKSF